MVFEPIGYVPVVIYPNPVYPRVDMMSEYLNHIFNDFLYREKIMKKGFF